MKEVTLLDGNVYVVTWGSYSDYHIEGIFSSLSEAEAYAKITEGGVETWLVDEFAGYIKRLCFWAIIRFGDGSIIKEGCAERPGLPTARIAKNILPNPETPEWARCTYVSFVSPEHARKLAAEARQHWLRVKATTPIKGE